MSWGIQNRLKKILGFSEDMEYGENQSANQETKFSNKSLTEYSKNLTPEQAQAGANSFWEKQKNKAASVATTDLPKPLTDIKNDRDKLVEERNKRTQGQW